MIIIFVKKSAVKKQLPWNIENIFVILMKHLQIAKYCTYEL